MSVFMKEDLHRIEKKLNELLSFGENIMSVISDFAAQQDAFNAQMDASLTDLQAEVTALQAAVAALPAGVTAADQAALDALTAHAKTMADQLAALDALAKPVAPAPAPTPAAPASA